MGGSRCARAPGAWPDMEVAGIGERNGGQTVLFCQCDERSGRKGRVEEGIVAVTVERDVRSNIAPCQHNPNTIAARCNDGLCKRIGGRQAQTQIMRPQYDCVRKLSLA